MFEMMVGLNVTDDPLYDQYRAGMSPILSSYGGFFRFDLVVSKMLKSAAEHPINRVFSLCFPDRQKRDAFFSDPAYKKVREEFLAKSVSGRTLIAEYDR